MSVDGSGNIEIAGLLELRYVELLTEMDVAQVELYSKARLWQPVSTVTAQEATLEVKTTQAGIAMNTIRLPAATMTRTVCVLLLAATWFS